MFTNPCRYYWGDIKDPAFLAKLLSRQRRHHREARALPLFRDTEQAPGLFNDAGEQDVGNPLLASSGKLGRDYIYLLAGLERYEELDAFVDIAPITCCITCSRISLNYATRRWPGRAQRHSPTVATNVRLRWMTAV